MSKFNKYTGLVAFLAVMFFFACKRKTYRAALPNVQFNSALPYGTNSLLLQGQVTSIGAANIQYVGFSYSTQRPGSSILQNQILLGAISGSFQAVIPAYHDTVYYFRAFAANEYGYSKSEELQFSY